MSKIARVMRGILTVSLGVGALVLTVMSVRGARDGHPAALHLKSGLVNRLDR